MRRKKTGPWARESMGAGSSMAESQGRRVAEQQSTLTGGGTRVQQCVGNSGGGLENANSHGGAILTCRLRTAACFVERHDAKCLWMGNED